MLQGLVKEALKNNYNIQIAATRILEANANLGIVRANQFPTLNASDTLQYTRTPINPSAVAFNMASMSLNYIVDFWGQYRRATQ